MMMIHTMMLKTHPLFTTDNRSVHFDRQTCGVNLHTRASLAEGDVGDGAHRRGILERRSRPHRMHEECSSKN